MGDLSQAVRLAFARQIDRTRAECVTFTWTAESGRTGTYEEIHLVTHPREPFSEEVQQLSVSCLSKGLAGNSAQ